MIQNDDEEIEIHKYGLEITLIDWISNLLLMVVSALIGDILYAVVHIVFFSPIRIYGGGYHTNTHLGCMLLTLVNFLAIRALAWFIQYPPLVMLLLPLLLTNVAVVLLAPVPHPNNPQGSAAISTMRRKCIHATLILTVISIVLFMIGFYGYSVVSVYSALSASASLCVARVVYRKGIKERHGITPTHSSE